MEVLLTSEHSPPGFFLVHSQAFRPQQQSNQHTTNNYIHHLQPCMHKSTKLQVSFYL